MPLWCIYDIHYVDKRSLYVPGNGGIVSGRSDTVTFSHAIPGHACLWVVEEVGDLLIHEVAVFRLIPHGIQQAPNVHPM